MKIFDFNIHLPKRKEGISEELILDETNITIEEIELCYSQRLNQFRNNIATGNFMILNSALSVNKELAILLKKIKKDFHGSLSTILVDFRISDCDKYMEKVVETGVDGIKLHSYLQMIAEGEYPDVLRICKIAEQNNLFICFDTSYGTSKMYEYDNLKLAAYISEHIKKVPIILLHSAGLRVLEGMLLASDNQNIYLETSFSIPYYLGSTVEQDIAFAYKKLGSERILYGSDFPYVDFEESTTIMEHFLEKYHFNDKDRKNIFFENAINLKPKYKK